MSTFFLGGGGGDVKQYIGECSVLQRASWIHWGISLPCGFQYELKAFIN